MSTPGPVWTELGRADGTSGEVVLRRRATGGGGALVELVVGGVLVMDDGDASTERLLARAALDALAADGHRGGAGWRVLVGGLGLGFTLVEVLTDPRVGEAVVVELEPSVVGWVRAGLVPATAGALRDPRARAVVADVVVALREAAPGSLDAVLLDVDNGPGFLVAPANARLYDDGGLAAAAAALAPGGVLAVWCSHDPAQLAGAARAAEALTAVRVLRQVVEREGRALEYWLLLARRRGSR
ncbi:spermine/spermidine synthase domain-containing protein [Quadrisphaera sp. KR29]|uniref:spermine/spermidine synthase domain-containing protein n=1 Tax=Quadrisphaera sp. KR29 TaxID=3461391 RepID=UPI004043F6AA